MSDKIEWETKEIPLSKLKNFEKNPRTLKKHDRDQLKTSLTKFGQCEDIVLNTDYTIIGGHQRVRTLKSLGKKTAHCKIPLRTLDQKEVEELNIRLNRVHGDFDFDGLSNNWNLPELLEWGFTPADFQIEDEKPEKPKKLKITIEVDDEDEYYSLEQKILEMIGEYPSAKLK